MIIEDSELTEEYWDCECFKNFIHHQKEKTCDVCGARREDQPFSRIKEVKMQGFVINEE